MLVATNTYEAFKLKGLYYFNYKNTGFDVYQTKSNYPITIILDDFLKPIRNGTLIIPRDSEYQLWQTLLTVADYWADTIGYTDAKECIEPVYIPFYDSEGNRSVKVNPLINENNRGITINVCGLDTQNKSFGETIINLTRSRSVDKNTPTYLLPYHCTLLLNVLRFNTACNGLPYIDVNDPEKHFFRVPFQPKFDNYPYLKDNIWYLLSHQMCHCLGFGTMWYVRNYKGKLIRSFIVGAGDTSDNINKTNRLNLFYTTNKQDTQRDVKSDIAVFVGDSDDITRIGDAKYTDVFNNNSSKKDFPSRALQNFNLTLNTKFSAIPVENNGTADSMGIHWEEGCVYDTENKLFESRGRKYYGRSIQGLTDELMSTALNVFKPSPVSDITLGAVQDLGYTVNFSKAEKFKPLIFNINCSNIKNYQTTINYNSPEYINILGFNPFNVYVPGQDAYIARDWINDPAANHTDIIENENNSIHRQYNDPRNTPLICRRGFTYIFNCYGTVTLQEPSLAPIIAKNVKLARDNTRIFDIIDSNDNVVSVSKIEREGLTVVSLELKPRDIDKGTEIYWLRVGVKNDKALLNSLKYLKDSKNFTFISLLPVYIYG
jgi:hypothetical protein